MGGLLQLFDLYFPRDGAGGEAQLQAAMLRILITAWPDWQNQFKLFAFFAVAKDILLENDEEHF